MYKLLTSVKVSLQPLDSTYSFLILIGKCGSLHHKITNKGCCKEKCVICYFIYISAREHQILIILVSTTNSMGILLFLRSTVLNPRYQDLKRTPFRSCRCRSSFTVTVQYWLGFSSPHWHDQNISPHMSAAPPKEREKITLFIVAHIFQHPLASLGCQATFSVKSCLFLALWYYSGWQRPPIPVVAHCCGARRTLPLQTNLSKS